MVLKSDSTPPLLQKSRARLVVGTLAALAALFTLAAFYPLSGIDRRETCRPAALAILSG